VNGVDITDPTRNLIVMNGIVWALRGPLCGNSVRMQAKVMRMQAKVIVTVDVVVLIIVMLVTEMRLQPMLRVMRLIRLEVLWL
jgi:hypothetical protein